MRYAGLRELIGSWKIIPIPVLRRSGSFHFGRSRTSNPRKEIFPETMRDGGSGSRRVLAWDNVLFPITVLLKISHMRPTQRLAHTTLLSVLFYYSNYIC